MRLESALQRAAVEAVKAGRWDVVHQIGEWLCPNVSDETSREAKRGAPVSNAERQRRYRAARNARNADPVTDSVTSVTGNLVTGDATGDVTAATDGVTVRNAAPSPSHTLPLPETTSQVQENLLLSLPTGSLKQGSDLEDGVTSDAGVTQDGASLPARVTRRRASRAPESDVTADDLSAWRHRWGLLSAEPVEFAKFLDFHRAKGSLFVDWAAAWRTWQRNAATFARAAPRAPGRTVQPVDMTAPWMAEGYGETLGKEGTG